MKSQAYNSEFFDNLSLTSSSSAPFIANYIYHSFKPSTVVDIGCGTGEILKVLTALGGIECLGVEGPWIDSYQEHFSKIQLADLREFVPLGKKFDVAICLEVAEHLEERFASTLVSTLTESSDIILFSAAIPGQSGTEHINLQYPEYWAKHFWDKGFALYLDPRENFLKNFNIAPWYQQNTLVYRKMDDDWSTAEMITPKLIHHPLIFPNRFPLKTIIYRGKRKFYTLLKGKV